MKKRRLFSLLTVLVLLTGGCSVSDPAPAPAFGTEDTFLDTAGSDTVSNTASDPASGTVPGTASGTASAKLPPMVYLGGACLTSAGRPAVLDRGAGVEPDAAPDGLLSAQIPAGEQPDAEGEANFACEDVPYLLLADGAAAVRIDGVYQLFLSDDTVEYEGIYKQKKDVSEDTLQWLDFYHSLPEADRLALSMVPSEFYQELRSAAAQETSRETSDKPAVSYLEALTETELSETESLAMHYFTEVDPSFEGVDQIYPVDADDGNYQNAGLESEYPPGNIIIYKVLTVKDRRDGSPFRSISIGRNSKSDPWKVINSTY